MSATRSGFGTGSAVSSIHYRRGMAVLPRGLLLLSVVLCGIRLDAAEVRAVSPSRSAVLAAIQTANSGDTIFVPAGAATWSSEISIPSTKDLVLVGSGIGQTIITRKPAGTAVSFGQSASRISGFTFIEGGVGMGGTGWRVDHCAFTSTSGLIGVFPSGMIPAQNPNGLVDHCLFKNARVLIYGATGLLSEGDYQNRLWAQPLALGTDDAVFVEYCTFTNTIFGHAIDSNYGAKYVFRYNVLTDLYIECHSATTNSRASRSWEIYGNIINQVHRSIFMPFRLRGGTGVVFDNVIHGRFDNPNIGLDNVRSCEGACDGTSDLDGNQPGMAGYPCRDQIGRSTDGYLWTTATLPPPQALEAAYAWNNTTDTGQSRFVSIQCDVSQNHISEGRDFYNLRKPGYTPFVSPHPLSQRGPDVSQPTSIRLD
jgi:hypothetical protein